MINANFPTGIDEITIPSLFQWDFGLTLRISGANLPSVIQVHFCNKISESATVRLAYKQEKGHTLVENLILSNVNIVGQQSFYFLYFLCDCFLLKKT